MARLSGNGLVLQDGQRRRVANVIRDRLSPLRVPRCGPGQNDAPPSGIPSDGKRVRSAPQSPSVRNKVILRGRHRLRHWLERQWRRRADTPRCRVAPGATPIRGRAPTAVSPAEGRAPHSPALTFLRFAENICIRTISGQDTQWTQALRVRSSASTSAEPSPTWSCWTGRPARVRLAKVPSTPGQPGLRRAGRAERGRRSTCRALDLIVHGTTTTTNAVLERKLAKTGLITTAGFPRRAGTRPPHPAAGLRHDGRVHPDHPARPAPGGARADGCRGRRSSLPLDEAAVRAAGRHVCWTTGCESVVVHFLHAYANPAHELRAAEIAARPLAQRPHHHSAMRCCRKAASSSAG